MRQVDAIRYPPGNNKSYSDRYGNWMISVKGNRLFPLDLRSEDIDIEEIAHALSNICRFGGHCREFYSVAQHSVIVSDLCSKENELIGLLHDAAEAYCGDMVRPLKQHLSHFSVIERNIWTVIAQRFELPFDLPLEVEQEDARALLMEKRDILTHHEHKWMFPQCAFPDLTLPDQLITPINPKAARDLFLQRFVEVSRG